MSEYQCGNCREISRLGPSARFCPYCGSTSLVLLIKENTQSLPPEATTVPYIEITKEVEKPRRRKQASE